MSEAASCSGCGRTDRPLNDYRRCAECQEFLANLDADVAAGEVTLETLLEQIAAATGSDEVVDALAGARPPVDKLERQRWREALLRAMRGKAQSPAKIVDAWVGSAAAEHDVVLKQSGELVKLVLSHGAVLFHTGDRQAYVAIVIDGHREVMPVRSRAFKQWLARAFWEHTAAGPDRPDPDRADHETGTHGGLLGFLGGVEVARVPGSQALTDAMNTVEGMAVFDGPQLDVHVRVAHFGGKVYLDLGDDGWRAVEVDRDGWRVVDIPPVMFRRPAGLEALPDPASGGSLDDFRRFVNVTAAEWPLVVGYLAGLLSAGPYPVLVLLGEQGCGKTTAARMIRRIVDPSSSDARRKSRSDHDLAITADNNWVLSFDNLSSLPTWLSDALATIATGGGFATRMLYTDDEERIFDSKRPIILNGIGDVVARSDLLDRALLVRLPVIKDRMAETQLWGDYDAALPGLVGAVLDAVSVALAAVADVELADTPRMADFARWVTAAEPALGLADGEFLEADTANRAVADHTALEASPVGRFVMRLAEQNQMWEGHATELLEVVNAAANAADKVLDADKVGPTRRQEGWPKAANVLSNKLALLAPNLRRVGVDVTIDRDRSGSRITICRTRPL